MSFFGGGSTSARSETQGEQGSTIKPWGPARGALQGIGVGLGQIVNRPLNYYQGDRIADFDPRSLQAFEGMEGVSDVFGTSPADELNRTISGGYLPGQSGENPFLQQSIDYATAPVLEHLQSVTLPGISDAYAAAGRTGMSPSAIQRMGQEYRTALDRVGGLGASMAGTAYENERNRQMQAMGLIGQAYIPEQMRRTVGGEFETQRQREINDAMQRFYEQEREPFERFRMISDLALPIGAAFPETDSYFQSTTDSRSGSESGLFRNLAGGLGLGLMGAQVAGNLGAFGAPAALGLAGAGGGAGSGAAGNVFGLGGMMPGGYMRMV